METVHYRRFQFRVTTTGLPWGKVHLRRDGSGYTLCGRCTSHYSGGLHREGSTCSGAPCKKCEDLARKEQVYATVRMGNHP